MKLGNERGMVLLLVLVVVALLSALLSEFAFSTLVDMRLTETFRDTTRAEYLARGGITAGRMILKQDRNNHDSLDELWAMGVENYPVAAGAVSVKIEDLDGRLNLNLLVDNTGTTQNPDNYGRFVRLGNEIGLVNPTDLADALVDWLDHAPLGSPDTVTGSGGAEDAYYLSLNPPHEAADGPLHSLDELGLVRGFDSKVVEQLKPFVTCYGDGTLNVNTAAPELLRSWDTTTTVTAAAIDNLVTLREKAPFQNTNDVFTALGGISLGNIAFKSDFYQINSQGQVNSGARRMVAIVKKTGDELLWQKVN